MYVKIVYRDRICSRFYQCTRPCPLLPQRISSNSCVILLFNYMIRIFTLSIQENWTIVYRFSFDTTALIALKYILVDNHKYFRHLPMWPNGVIPLRMERVSLDIDTPHLLIGNLLAGLVLVLV